MFLKAEGHEYKKKWNKVHDFNESLKNACFKSKATILKSKTGWG